MYHLFRKKIDRRPMYLAVAAVAVVFVVGGYFLMDYVIGAVTKGIAVTPIVATHPVAPTTSEYEVEAEMAMRAFVTYLVARSTPVPVGDEMFRNLVQTVQTDMLGLRVPAERRDAHFAAVTLLDAWRAYLDGRDERYADLLSRTQKLTQDSPWLLLNVVR
jgi:hypothetical protein